jgi:hypothetical protein
MFQPKFIISNKAANALISLPVKPEQRIWIVLAELTSLQQLPYLTSGLQMLANLEVALLLAFKAWQSLWL